MLPSAIAKKISNIAEKAARLRGAPKVRLAVCAIDLWVSPAFLDYVQATPDWHVMAIREHQWQVETMLSYTTMDRIHYSLRNHPSQHNEHNEHNATQAGAKAVSHG